MTTVPHLLDLVLHLVEDVAHALALLVELPHPPLCGRWRILRNLCLTKGYIAVHGRTLLDEDRCRRDTYAISSCDERLHFWGTDGWRNKDNARLPRLGRGDRGAARQIDANGWARILLL